MGARAERRLLRRVRAGQRDACEELVRKHYRQTYAFLHHMSGDPALAEELTQETFTAAWANMERFEGRASFGTWLHHIAYTKLIDAKRKLQRRTAVVEQLTPESTAPRQASSPLDTLIADERTRHLQQAVDRLNGTQKVVIVLHYLQGLSLRETASVLGEPVGTVKWRTNQALTRLRQLLNGKMPP